MKVGDIIKKLELDPECQELLRRKGQEREESSIFLREDEAGLIKELSSASL